MTPPKNKVTVKFTKLKETPGTVRYAEAVPPGDVSRVSTQYLQKHFAEELGFPDELKVTFEAG